MGQSRTSWEMPEVQAHHHEDVRGGGVKTPSILYF
jgi:hypothetical protein